MPKWSASILERLVAPGITEFTEAEIPDLSDDFPQARYWLANHFLNSAFRTSYKEGYRQVVLGFLRRVHHAFVAFHSARERTLKYLDTSDPFNPSLYGYYDAVADWETFLLQVSMAIDLVKWLNSGQNVFEKNDGSPEQRLYTMANQLKHLASCVDSGQCGDTDTAPVWLSDEGLCSFGVEVTYQESATVLRDLAALADRLQDPLSFENQEEESE